MTFSAAGVPVLALFILALTLSVYLASLRSPYRATRYLLAAYALQVLWATAVLLDFSSGPSQALAAVQLVASVFIYWTTLQFCYTFLEQPFGREYVWVWRLSLAVTVAAVTGGLIAGMAVLTLLTVAVMTTIGMWALVVLCRKTVLLTREVEPDSSFLKALFATPVRSARAQRAVLAPVLIAISVIVLYALVLAGLASGVVYNVWLRIGLLVGLILFAMILFTYGRERHSVQIKLVGIALTIVLSVLAFVSMIVIEPVAGPGQSVLAGRMALVIVGASVLTAVIFPLAFRANLTRPIESLLTGIRRVDAGDLDVEVPVTVNDEIGEVTRSFNHMAASLSEYSERMEALVAERTSELEQSQARLIEQEKLASLGALTAGIAHEIKNPLNFVNNFADLTADLSRELREALEAYARPEVRQILDDIETNAGKIVEHGKRADTIVRSMLMHSRGGGNARHEEVCLNSLVKEYAGLAYHGMRALRSDFNCEVEYVLDEGLPRAHALPQELGRVLLNLLNNAFYAVSAAAGGDGARLPKVSVRTIATDHGYEIRVQDNGSGIPEATRARIFEPFFTTKPTGEGTGLGLSMSHDIIVHGHGGSIRVESEEGTGTTFIITLPINANGASVQ
jgi:two-component system, NtrC family, sensor kinase